MTTAATTTVHRHLAGPLSLVAGGLVVLALAWLLPAHLKSVSPVLLDAAGEGSPHVAELGSQLLDAEKLGPARMMHAAAETIGDPGAADLGRSLDQAAKRVPELMAWGGWDPFLDPLFKLHEEHGRAASTPVLDLFIPQQARESLRAFLSGSRSLGVQAVLATRSIDRTARFVPAGRAGGQPLEAVILLTAMLYQGDHLSSPLQREVRRLAEQASESGEMGPLEDFYLDVLTLGKRLDWGTLAELTRHTESVRTVHEYAHLAQLAEADLPLIYAAALCSESADTVATYLIRYGRPGLAGVTRALTSGRDAVRLLLARQVPVNADTIAAPGPVATLALLHPRITLVLKYAGFLAGAFTVLSGLSRWLFVPMPGRPRLRLQSSVLAAFAAALLVAGTEPFLLRAAPPSEFRFHLVMPVLATGAGEAPPPTTPTSSTTMDLPTLLSISLFACLQVLMYVICLLKIADIDRQPLAPLLKLRLMENEENLFDGGLYVGIAGTASALVLQVMRIIEPNLLAAYSSNLFGILCVALVKIRHVRLYKRRLILEAQSAIVPPAEPPAPAAPEPKASEAVTRILSTSPARSAGPLG